MTDINMNIIGTRFPTRFTYEDDENIIYVPEKTHKKDYKRFTTYFLWVINSLSHEEMHAILHHFISYKAMIQLDNFSYRDEVSGCIYPFAIGGN